MDIRLQKELFVLRFSLIAMVPLLAQELVLIMDSGGGTFLHVSPELALTCHRHNCRIFILPAHGTAAMCSLDQDVHKFFAAEWARFKSRWAATHGSLTCPQALAAASKIAVEALCQEKATKSYHAVGIDVGKPLNVNKLLVDRKDELFQSLRANSGQAPLLRSSNKRSFDVVAAISPPKTKCAQCKQKIDVVDKFCKQCGADNPDFDETLHGIHKSKKQSGWKANADYMSTKKPKTADEEELCLKTGDFLKKIRMRKKQPEVAVPDSSDGPTPAQQHIAVEPAGPSSAAQPPPVHEASPEKDEACSDDEHDLNTMEGCTNWMLCMFLPKNRAQLRHLAAFYLQNTLMPKVSKANPLFAEFTKTVVNGKLLHTKHSREMWIKATESNRSQRFAKVPKRGKA